MSPGAEALPTIWLLATARILPFGLWLTRIGHGRVPAPVAWSVVLSLAAFFADATPLRVAVPSGMGVVRLVLQEVAIGTVACFVLAAPFAALRVALSALGRTVGAPHGEGVAQVLGLGTWLVLFQLALPLGLVRALAETFDALPVGRGTLAPEALSWALFAVLGHASALCLSLTMPWLGALFALDLAFSVGALLAQSGDAPASLPLRVSSVGIALAAGWLAFAERFPVHLRGAFSLLRGVLSRVFP
jgi:flagellar biosynthesis protein FliR